MIKIKRKNKEEIIIDDGSTQNQEETVEEVKEEKVEKPEDTKEELKSEN